MPYIPPSVVREVKRMDLLTYLKNYEPYELVHFSGNTYTTRTHDSLKISNGKWMWWSQRTGGRSALDYLIKVRGYSFLEAVELLAERANIQPPLSVYENVPMEKQLLLPRKNQDNQKVIAYLSERGIDNEIIGNKYSPTVIVAAITSKEKMKLPTHIAIPEIEGLEKDSVVLLEQLRTLDKRRLENYVCTLDRTEMEKINKAIRRSTGIPKIIEKPLVVSLCRVCAGNFYDVPGHYIRRVNPEQRYKDTCMFCNVRNGYDYYIGRKNK